MRVWILIAGLLAASLASAATPAPPVFPPHAEATETRISAEVGPLLRAWARSEAGYSTRVSQIVPDLQRAFPQIEAGAQIDAITFLVLMEKVRIEAEDIAKLRGAGKLNSDQQTALDKAQVQHDQAQAMIVTLLPSLGETADPAIKAIKG